MSFPQYTYAPSYETMNMSSFQDPLYADLCQVLSKILARGYYNPYSCTSAIALLDDCKVRLQACCSARYRTDIRHSCTDMNHTGTQELASMKYSAVLPVLNINRIVYAWSEYEKKFGPLIPGALTKVYVGSPILPGEWEQRAKKWPDQVKMALMWKFQITAEEADEIMTGS